MQRYNIRYDKNNKMRKRVVITGIGVVASNGVGTEAFKNAIMKGRSGIEYYPHLKELGFSCCIGGIPTISDELKKKYLSDLQLRNFNSNGILYGCIAGMDAWKDAGLKITDEIDYNSGTIYGAGTSSVDKFRESIYKIDDHKVKRLGSTAVAQTMASGVSAYLGGILGLGNQVTTNSSACTTGTEAIMMGYNRIVTGQADRMLVGSCSDDGAYIWGGFDAIKVLTYKHNDNPTQGSRPMSATASGFVPGGGAGALLIESLDSAIQRKATIYGEIIGGHINSGGQRNGGTMTAPNNEAVRQCITRAMDHAGIKPEDIDTINGHLTATKNDHMEIKNWLNALGLEAQDFPPINSLKSMIGHCLAAAGSIECVACVLQLHNDFIFPNINCEDVSEEIKNLIPIEKIPQKLINKKLTIIAKSSFGFGDVNGCVIFKKYKQ
jgi:3-oxoacyl-(acyl-carrier-protein) synthase